MFVEDIWIWDANFRDCLKYFRELCFDISLDNLKIVSLSFKLCLNSVGIVSMFFLKFMEVVIKF